MPSIGSPCCDYRKAVATVAANASGCATTTAAATTAICTVASGPANTVLASATRAAGKPKSVRKGDSRPTTDTSGTTADSRDHANGRIACDVATSCASVSTAATRASRKIKPASAPDGRYTRRRSSTTRAAALLDETSKKP